MIISKETILTQGYQLPLNGLQLFGVSTRYIIPYTWGVLEFGSN